MLYEELQKPGVGTVIGRFQTPTLHVGHMNILNHAAMHTKMLILVGCHALPGTHGHELDFETRKSMLAASFPKAVIMPLYDTPTDEVWSQNIDNVIRKQFPFSSPTFYHGRDSFVPHYKGKLTNFVQVDESEVSATRYRKYCYEKVVEHEHFRHGVFYGINNLYPRLSPTVDIAIMRWQKKDDVGSYEQQILVGKKAHDPRGWRFPGGYVDLKDGDLETAARREAEEETGLKVTDLVYVCSRKINDWRDTKTNGNLTTFFLAQPSKNAKDYNMSAVAGDDLCEVMWVFADEIKHITLVPEHEILTNKLIPILKNIKTSEVK